MAPRRWLLFGLSMASLLVLSYAAVVYALSVPVSEDAARAHPDLTAGHRAFLAPIVDPNNVATHERGEDAALIAAGQRSGAFPANAENVSYGRALVYASRGMNGSYFPSSVDLVDVPTADGPQNLTINVSAFATGGDGWIVMGTGEREPRFIERDDVLGTVRRVESTTGLAALFVAGLLGFFAPLIALVTTHKPSGRRGPGSAIVCNECRAPLGPGVEFCLRCGAYKRET